MNEIHTELLRTAITAEVFVAGDTRHIASSTGEPDRWMFDFRRIMLRPEILHAYTELFFEKYRHVYPFQVCGLEVAAIPLVAAIVSHSHRIGLPVNGFFIRKSRKKSGLLNMIEGEVTDIPIILVDDIINSGGSFMRQVTVLEALSAETGINHPIVAAFSILQFSPLKRYTDFHERGIAIDSLFMLEEFQSLIAQVTLPTPKPETKNHFTVAWTWHDNNPSYELVRPKTGLTSTKDNRLYTNTDAGNIVCLDTHTGHEVWRQKIPFNLTKRKQFSRPLIIDDVLICGAFDGNIYGFDAITGARRWVCFDADWITGSPCTGKDGSFYIPLEFGFFKKRSNLAYMDYKNGSIHWHTPILEGALQSPAFSPKYSLVVAGTDTGRTYAFNAKNGTVIWNTSLPVRIVAAPAISEETGIALVTGLAHNDPETAGVFALDLSDGSLKWENTELMYGSYGTPVVYRNLVLITGLDKTLRALDMHTGKTIWKTDFASRVFATPVCGRVRSAEYIYLGTNDSILYEIDPATGTIIGASMFAERITNEVILDEDNNRIFVPTYANEVYAITTKP